MVTPYTTAAPMPVMDTYVPIPFEALAQAGATRQQQYTTAVGMEDTLTDALDQYRGLKEVFVPGKGMVEAQGSARVEREKQRIRGSIDTLIKESPDKFDAGYTSKLKNIYRDLKRSASTGILGQEQAAYEAHGKVMETLGKDKDFANAPWIGLDIAKSMSRYAEAGIDATIIPTISPNLNTAKYINVSKEIADNAASKVKKRIIADYGLTDAPDDPEAFKQHLILKGVPVEVIEQAVLAEIQVNPAIYNSLKAQAEMNVMAGGEDNLGELINAQVAAAAIKFGYAEADVNYLRNPRYSGKDDFSTGEGLKREVPVSLTSELDRPSYGFITATGREIADNISNLKKENVAIKERYNIVPQIGEDGIIENYEGYEEVNGVKQYHDLTDEIKFNEHQQLILENKQDRFNTIHEQALDYAGLEDSGVLEDIYDSAAKSYALIKSRDTVGYGRGSKSTFNKEAYDEALITFETEEASVKEKYIKNAGERSEFSAQMNLYNKYLENNYADKSVDMIVHEFTKKDLQHPFISKLTTIAPDFKNSTELLIPLGSKTPLEEDEYGKLDLDAATVNGWGLDPNDNNKSKLMYYIPSKNDKEPGVTIMGGSVPIGFDNYLMKTGHTTEMELKIASQINNQIQGNLMTSPEPIEVTLGEDIQFLLERDNIELPEGIDPIAKFVLMGPNATGIPNKYELFIKGQENRPVASGSKGKVQDAMTSIYLAHKQRIESTLINLRKNNK